MTREEFCTISSMQTMTNKRHNTHATTRINSLTALRSYNSLCVVIDSKLRTVTLFPHYDYSNTTKRHVYNFMQEYGFTSWCGRTLEKDKLIKSGTIVLDSNRYYL